MTIDYEFEVALVKRSCSIFFLVFWALKGTELIFNAEIAKEHVRAPTMVVCVFQLVDRRSPRHVYVLKEAECYAPPPLSRKAETA